MMDVVAASKEWGTYRDQEIANFERQYASFDERSLPAARVIAGLLGDRRKLIKDAIETCQAVEQEAIRHGAERTAAEVERVREKAGRPKPMGVGA
jgi:hypothetical protein